MTALTATRAAVGRLAGAAPSRLATLADRPAARVTGRVVSVVGLVLDVAGLRAAVGDLVRVHPAGAPALLAEVVAVDAAGLRCLPLGRLEGVAGGDPVTATGSPLRVPVGRALLGRVLDGLGRPLDGRPLPAGTRFVGVDAEPPSALARPLVEEPLGLGVRALDTLVPAGRGQRLGIFAGSGVGKSSLLSMVTRGTSADVVVLALVGERGREVREFVDRDLGQEGLARSVVVVATSDTPPAQRLKAAFTATRIAESFRDEGLDVLLLTDSLTRVAMAQREVGLSAGEPPATRGYPPSTFAVLPRLLERAGPAPVGSITGVYTVLVDGDDMDEPVADAARSILDGHVVLDRALATAGHFPSIDVLESVSRVAGAVTTPEQRRQATLVRQVLAAARDARQLVEVGAYVPGSNPLVDAAVAHDAEVMAFLRQEVRTTTDARTGWAALAGLADLLQGAVAGAAATNGGVR
jgi:flagellum-specific ATP synthase